MTTQVNKALRKRPTMCVVVWHAITHFSSISFSLSIMIWSTPGALLLLVARWSSASKLSSLGSKSTSPGWYKSSGLVGRKHVNSTYYELWPNNNNCAHTSTSSNDCLTRDQLPRDQFLPDQLCMRSIVSRSTLIESPFHRINSTPEINSNQL